MLNVRCWIIVSEFWIRNSSRKYVNIENLQSGIKHPATRNLNLA